MQVANGVVWKRRVDHLQKIIDNPQREKEVAVPDTTLYHHHCFMKGQVHLFLS